MMHAEIPSYNLHANMYMGQNRNLSYSLTLQVLKPGESAFTWNFISNGHIHGPKGRIVVESDLNKKADKSYADAINAKTNNKSQVAILSGTIGHGGTIPLPVGFAESQCRWTVSPRKITAEEKLGAFECYADTRKVCSREYDGHNHYWSDANANYIIIGVK